MKKTGLIRCVVANHDNDLVVAVPIFNGEIITYIRKSKILAWIIEYDETMEGLGGYDFNQIAYPVTCDLNEPTGIILNVATGEWSEPFGECGTGIESMKLAMQRQRSTPKEIAE